MQLTFNVASNASPVIIVNKLRVLLALTEKKAEQIMLYFSSDSGNE